ncbi:capsular associated protein [Armillaria mellea]|nr:capsular associated protein [Armillaria mellea]
MRLGDRPEAQWARHSGYFFLAFVFIVFLQAGLWAESRSHAELDIPKSVLSGETTSVATINTHPIPKLIEAAEEQYRAKVTRQSQTLEDAVTEYKRRYHRPPPKGFDAWWRFAKDNDVIMVDEYDGLMEDLEPFWSMPGQELRRRSRQAAELPSIDLVRVRNGKATLLNLNRGHENSDVSARAQGLHRMMEKFVHTLPDMDFPVNANAEGRVTVPWEHRKYTNLTNQDSTAGVESMLGGEFIPDWRGDGNVWEAMRRTCEPRSPARRLYASTKNVFSAQPIDYMSGTQRPGSDFHFLSSSSANLDFCTLPHAHYQQGLFFSDWRTIPVLYPVFSPAKARGFMDIKIPSHYYYGSTKRYTYGWDPINLELKETDDMEVPWEQKLDVVFWRGSSIGGGNNPSGFSPQYHRQRFVRMASQTGSNNRTVTFEDPPSSSRYVSVPVSTGKLNEDIMNVAFTKATNPEAYPGGLTELVKDHRFGDAVWLGYNWKYKYIMDLDGMSYSGRFMAFLASDSVPVKATMYKEFYSDWIQPWVHYIPLSTTYKEIYNIHAYFSGPSPATVEAAESLGVIQPHDEHISQEADRQLRRIARAGKQWKKTMGRTIDMDVYVYRLCLEYARLLAEDRDLMVYDP